MLESLAGSLKESGSPGGSPSLRIA